MQKNCNNQEQKLWRFYIVEHGFLLVNRKNNNIELQKTNDSERASDRGTSFECGVVGVQRARIGTVKFTHQITPRPLRHAGVGLPVPTKKNNGVNEKPKNEPRCPAGCDKKCE